MLYVKQQIIIAELEIISIIRKFGNSRLHKILVLEILNWYLLDLNFAMTTCAHIHIPMYRGCGIEDVV